ncbi:MAG: hypothetical protein CMP77_15375 [Flavobacterium sp.]|nr:hypothetical protein [Flavobacterium sp.]
MEKQLTRQGLNSIRNIFIPKKKILSLTLYPPEKPAALCRLSSGLYTSAFLFHNIVNPAIRDF